MISRRVDCYWEPAEPAEDYVPCCMGAAVNGPRRCTCWTPIFDVEQQPPQPGTSRVRPELCFDCAYRKDSPERSDQHASEFIDDLAIGGAPFYCHQGTRRIVAWVHPDGRRVESAPGDYQPITNEDDCPVRADGTPMDLCAGWFRLHQKESVCL